MLVSRWLAGDSARAQAVGTIKGQDVVGKVLHPGAARFDAASGAYTLSGNGENMWAGQDDFHFVWSRMSGDVALTADVDFMDAGGHPHPKAVLLVRQSLDPHVLYADAAKHGDGLTSQQSRNALGVDTHEIETNARGPHGGELAQKPDPRQQDNDPGTLPYWQPSMNMLSKYATPDYKEWFRTKYKMLLQQIPKQRALGVQLLAGTDLRFLSPVRGPAFTTKSGCSPQQA